MKSVKIVNNGDEIQDFVLNGELVTNIAPGGYMEVTVPDGHLFRAEAHPMTGSATYQPLATGEDSGKPSEDDQPKVEGPVAEAKVAEEKVAEENQAATITTLRNPVPDTPDLEDRNSPGGVA